MRNLVQILSKIPLWVIKKNSLEKGQTLLELALVTPFLMLLAFGIIEFGRAYYQYNTLTKAVRDGARYMSYHIFNSTEEGRCKNVTVYGDTVGSSGGHSPVLANLTAADVELMPSASDPAYTPLTPPRFITVRITNYQFQPLISLIKLNANFNPEITMKYVGPGSGV